MSKSYLKILSLLYIIDSTNLPITSDIVIGVLKETYIFNNMAFASKLYIIKASNNLDSAVVQIDI